MAVDPGYGSAHPPPLHPQYRLQQVRPPGSRSKQYGPIADQRNGL